MTRSKNYKNVFEKMKNSISDEEAFKILYESIRLGQIKHDELFDITIDYARFSGWNFDK